MPEPTTTTSDDDLDCSLCEGTGEWASHPGRKCTACDGTGRLPTFDAGEFEAAKDRARYGE